MSKKTYLVEAVSYFRIRYVVEAESKEEAETIISNDERHEFSQLHVDERVLSTRDINEETYLELFDEDNDYLSSWSKKAKLNFINRRKDV
jgi:hypothetical protein